MTLFLRSQGKVISLSMPKKIKPECARSAYGAPPVYERLCASHRWSSHLVALVGTSFLVHWGVTGVRSKWGSFFFLGAVLFLLAKRRILKAVLSRDAVKKDLLACLECGYHLVGIDSGRCPECGQAFELDATRRVWKRWLKADGARVPHPSGTPEGWGTDGE